MLSSSAMASRLEPPKQPVEFEFDGEAITAERGEPLAFALIAADRLALSRSPKLHRPHGPYCLRGGCDGCILRVNGEPNVLTCLRACQGGERAETQNVLGSRKMDLMRVTDWFFPQGIDHHHFLAGVPAASFVVQKVARHVPGLGRLPDDPRGPGAARREEADVLIVGAGPAGLTVALLLASSTPALRIIVADDGVAPGGSLRARGMPVPDPASVQLYRATAAAGIYDQEVLLIGEEAILVKPRALVLATGVHDAIAPFAGNDLPGVVSARAAALLAHHGILIGRKVAILGAGPYADAFLTRMRGRIEAITVPEGVAIAVEGRARVTSVAIRDPASRSQARRSRASRRTDVDAVLVEVAGAPSFELAEQAGARIVFDPTRGGYLPETDPCGRAVDSVWCAGELAGTGPSLEVIRSQAQTVGSDVRRFFS